MKNMYKLFSAVKELFLGKSVLERLSVLPVMQPGVAIPESSSSMINSFKHTATITQNQFTMQTFTSNNLQMTNSNVNQSRSAIMKFNSFLGMNFVILLIVIGSLGAAWGQSTAIIGTGTLTSTVNPVQSNYGYNYTQQIYTASEMSTAGISTGSIISKIAFYWNGAGDLGNCGRWTIYLGNTSTSAFSATTANILASAMTKVCDSVAVTLPGAAGWMTINLTTPFTYNGTNLVVAVDENNAQFSTASATWRYSTTTGNTAVYYYSDTYNHDPAVSYSTGATAAVTTSRPNIQLTHILPCVSPSAQPTSLVAAATAGTTNSITGSFTAASPAPNAYLVVRTSSNVQPAPVNGTAYTVGAATFGAGSKILSYSGSTSFTDTGLTASTTYYYWIFSSSGFCTGEAHTFLTTDTDPSAPAPLSGSATTNTPVPASCASSFIPANAVTGFRGNDTLKWSGAFALPSITGYDVYFSTSQTLVSSMDATVRVLTNTTNTYYLPSTVLAYTTTYYWMVVPKNVSGPATGCAVNTFTTAGATVPNCATTFTPTSGATAQLLSVNLVWSGATGLPSPSGYDVYLSASYLDVANQVSTASILSNSTATTLAPGITTYLLAPGTTYYWMVLPRNTAGVTASCVINSFSTLATAAAITSTARGGLWNDVNTWVGGVIPTGASDVVIADGATVTMNLTVSCRSITIGQGGGSPAILQSDATARAITTIGDIVIASNGYLYPYNTLAAGAIITVGGNFTNNGYANLAVASTGLYFNGSQIGGGSAAQVLGGTGIFEGDTLGSGVGRRRGIIRDLRFLTTGASVISTRDSLVAYTLNHTNGSLNTNGKLTVDNSPQIFGKALNRQVANVAVTAMGSGYTGAPDIVPSGTVVRWTSVLASAAIGSLIVHNSNVYVVDTAISATFAAPTHTSGNLNKLLWVGTTGTLGSAVPIGSAPAIGNAYFIGNKLFLMKGTNTLSGVQAIALVTGARALTTLGSSFASANTNSDTLVYIGSPATATVNHDATSSTVRSLTITSAGSGYYSAAPSVGFLVTNGGTGALATAVLLQNIVGPANSLVLKSPAATITGGLQTVSKQSVTSMSATTRGIKYGGTPRVGFPLPIGFRNLVTNGGSGYTTLPTVTVSGGTKLGATTLPTFTVIIAKGKVVSVICLAGGTGWLTLPTLALTGGAGTGALAAFPAGCLATATAVMENGSIKDFTITNGGADYTAAPTPSLDSTGGTPMSAAATLSSRVGLYNLTYAALAPFTSAPVATMGVEVPTNNRINVLSIGSTTANTAMAQIILKDSLELYAGLSALTLMTSTTYGSYLDLNNFTLKCAHPGYVGVGTLGGLTTPQLAFGYVKNGIMELSSPGGSLTRTFPFDAPIAIATGTGSDGTTGSGITSIRVSQAAKPTFTSGNTTMGSRSWKVETYGGNLYGTGPTAAISYNLKDSMLMTLQQQYLFVGKAASPSGTSGVWSKVSASSGTTATLAVPTGTRTSATTLNGPFTPETNGINYFAWLDSIAPPTITGSYGSYCTGGGTSVTITGSGFSNITAVTFNNVAATSYVVNSSTSITAVTPAGITGGAIRVTANGVTGASGNYSVTTTPAITATVTPATPLICAAGDSVIIQVDDLGADSYDWTGGTGLVPFNGGRKAVIKASTSTAYTLSATFASAGCVVSKTYNVGVIPSAALAPSATPPSVCFNPGLTVTLNSNLSAGNFTVTPITYAASPVPVPGASAAAGQNTPNYVQDRGVTVVPFTLGGSQDDGGFQDIPIGFNYNFFGTRFDRIAAGSNGTLQFGPVVGFGTTAGQLGQYTFNTNNGIMFPNPSNPGNVISTCSGDMHIGTSSATYTCGLTSGSATVTTASTTNMAAGDSISGTGIPSGTKILSINGPGSFTMSVNATATGSAVSVTVNEKPTIRYWVDGVAPTRRFIVEYFGIRQYDIASNRTFLQAMFYETTGIVELHIGKMITTSLRTIGLQNATKTIGAVAPGRSGFITSITTPEAWRFNPPTNYTYLWGPSTGLSSTTTNSTTYTLTEAGVKTFTLQVINPGTTCQSKANLVLAANPTPTAPTVTGVLSLCGSGFTALTTSEPATGNTVKWYNDPLSGTLLGSQILYITPTITTTTTYYVAQQSSTCASTRTAVTVTVNVPPTFTINKPVLCGGATSTMLSVTSDLSNYDTYIWTPYTGLYEDAALTIPYGGANRSTVYAGGLAPGLKKYYCAASNFQNLCAIKDSAEIHVQPASATITSVPSSICVSGTAVLSLNAATAVAKKSVKWQVSDDGANFTDIAGADSTAYVTPTISTTKYYRAVLLSGDRSVALSTTCATTPVFTLTVNNPQVSSTLNGSYCGTASGGSVTLSATAASGTIKWYSALSGGTSLATGTSYTTPVITSTTTYYAELTVDGCAGVRTAVTANLSEAQTITLTASATVCNDAVVPVTIISGASNYSSVTWTPAASLFTDAAGTIPYVAGANAATVYFRSATAGSTKIKATAYNSTSLCTTSDSTTIIVLSGSITATATSSTICNSGSTSISLSPSTGYGAASIVWQKSTNGGASFTTLVGENGATLPSTGDITQTTIFKALIIASNGDTCSRPTATVTYSSPAIGTTAPATRCGNGSITLGATGVGTLNWYAASTGGASLGTGGTFTTTVYATTTYFVAATLNGCEGLRSAVTASVITAADVSVTASQTVCNGAITALTAGSTSDYDVFVWSPANNLYTDALATVPYVPGSSASTVYLSSTQSGKVTLTVAASNSGNGCTNSNVTEVTILPASITASASNTSLCKSGSSVISLSPSSGYGDASIQWQASLNGSTFTNIVGATGTSVSVTSLTATTTYKAVISVGGSACATPSATVTVNNPKVSAATGDSRCGTGIVNLTATAAAGTIKWYAAATGGTALATGDTYSPSVSATKNFYIALTLNGCTGDRDSVTATVSSPNTLTLSASALTRPCDSAAVAISVTSDTANFSTYIWAPADSLYLNAAATIPYDGSSQMTVYARSSVSGTTVYTVTGTLAPCANTASCSVTVNPVNAITLSLNGSTTVCNDAISELSVATGASSYNKITWGPAAGLYSDAAGTVAYVAGSNASTVYVRNSTAGSYSYTAFAADSTGASACVAAASASFVVLPASATSVSVNNTDALCRSGSRIFTVATSIVMPAGSIRWESSTDGGTTFSSIIGATSDSYTASISSAAQYRVTFKNSAGSVCYTSDPIAIVVNNPTVTSATGASRCGTGTLTLTANGSTGATLSWFTAASGGSALGTGASFITPTISSTKTYYVEASIGTCVSTSRTAVTATIGTAATVNGSASPSVVCSNGIATLSASSSGTYSTYIWSPVTGLFNDAACTDPYLAGTNANTVYFTSSTSGSATYVVTANNPTTFCSKTANVTVTVLPTTGNITSNKGVFCRSGSAIYTLNTATSVPAGRVQWQASLNGSTYSDVVGATNTTYAPGTVSTATYYQAQVKDANGSVCFTTAPFFHDIYNPLVATSTGAGRCGTGTLTLAATASSGATLNWYSASSGGNALVTGTSFTTPSISVTTTYYVDATIGTCISASRTAVTATISSAPALTVTTGAIACNNGVVALTITSTQSNYDSYVWAPDSLLYTDAAGTVPYVAGSSATTVYVKSANAGVKNYTVSASNAIGCAATASVSATVQPASATAAKSSPTGSICVSGTATLGLTPASGFASSSIQWQSSADGSTYANVSGTSASYTTAALTSSTYFQALIKNSNGDACITTNSVLVSVETPLVSSTSGNTRCGFGSTTLSATAASGTVRWYDVSSDGSIQGTGLSFSTPNISSTTTYYAALYSGTCEGTRTAVTATVNAAPALTVSPARDTFCNNTIQTLSVSSTLANYDSYSWSPATNLYTDAGATIAYVAGANASTVYLKRATVGNQLYTCSAINAAGCNNTASALISIQPATVSISGSPASICVSGTSTLSLSPSGIAGGSAVWNVSDDNVVFAPIAGVTGSVAVTDANTATKYYTARIYDGVGGALCASSSVFTLTYTNPVLNALQTSFVRCGSGAVTLSATATDGTVKWYSAETGGTALASGNTFTTPFLNATTTYYASAESGDCATTPRTAITAAASTPPFLTLSSSQTVCNGVITPLSVTSTLTDYSTYTWSPAIDLYTDAAATVPYVLGTSVTTVYAKRSIAGSITYNVSASNAECSNTASTTLAVQLSSATVSGSPSSICVNGTATLSMSPTTPYGLGSIQWQRSTDSINWISSPGAVSTTYTTPLQADTRYYRAIVKNGVGDICFATPIYTLAAINPQVLSITGASRCGTQSVPLSATGPTGATLNWYATASSTTVLGTGATYNTPILSATTTYFVQASIGTCVGGRVPVTATITAPPAFTVTTSQQACNATVLPLTVTAGQADFDSIVWSPATYLFQDAACTVPYVANANSATVYYKRTTTGSTTYTATARNAATTCVNIATTVITSGIMNLTGISSSDADSIICTATAITLTAIGSTGYSYSWTPGDSTGRIVTFYPSTPGINTYSVTAYDFATGCTSTKSIDINALALPTSPVGVNSSQCGFGVPQAFVVSGGANGTFYWYSAAQGGTLLQTGGSTYNSAINATTTFYVAESNGICQSLRVPIVASVTQPDAVAATASDSSVCLGDAVTISAVKAAGTNNYVYSWSVSPATGSGFTAPTAGESFTVTPTVTGNYTFNVTAYDSATDCRTISSVTITVNGLPVIDSVIASKSSICLGDSTTLSAYSSGISSGSQVLPTGYCSVANLGVSTVSYFNAFSTTGATQNINNAESGYSASGYGNFTNLIATTSPGQVISFNTTLIGTTVGVAIWVDWNKNGTYETTERVFVSSTYLSTAAGSFTVPSNVTAGRAGMRIMMDYLTSVPANPCAISTSGRGEVEDYSIQIIAGGTQDTTKTYVWTPGGLTGANVKVAPQSNTTYTVSVTSNVTGCTKTATQTITVNPIPATPTGSTSEQCGFGVPTATVTSNSGIIDPVFKWYTEPTGGTPVQSSASNNYDQRLLATDTFYVSEVSAAGCESPGRARISISVTIPDAIAPAATAASYCIGSAITLNANHTQVDNNYSFTWTANPVTGSGIPTSLSGDGVSVTPTAPGTYSYICTAVDPDRECTNVQSVSVTIVGLPQITTVTKSQDTICSGSSVTLTGTTNGIAAGLAILGTGTVVNTTTAYPTPFGQFYGSSHEQYLFRASELTAKGMSAGNITSIAFNMSAGYTDAPLQNFQVNMAPTNLIAMTSTLAGTGFTNVVPSGTYTPSTSPGYSTITFTNPFVWDGVSNVVLDVSFSNCSVCNNTTSCTTSYSYNGIVNQSTTGFVSTVNFHADGNCTINSFTPSITGTTYSQRPNVRFGAQLQTAGASGLNWTWNPGGVTGASVTVSPATTTTYTVTATDPASGCTSAPGSVTVNVVPTPGAPTANNSTQCGAGIPTASVTSNTGIIDPVFKWYSMPVDTNTVYYNNDFSTSLKGATLSGVAGSLNGKVRLTTTNTNELGGMTIPASGVNAQKYFVDFTMSTGGGGGADGLSYSFADDANAAASSPVAEYGTGKKLRISFDTYGSGAGMAGIRVLYNSSYTTDANIGITPGVNGVLAYSDSLSWIGQSNVPVSATINESGKLNLWVNGSAIFTNLQLPPDFLSSDKSLWKHVFKGRTGGLAMEHSIDNVSLRYFNGFLGTGANCPAFVRNTTTFYVSESNGICQGPRAAAVATVYPPDSINAVSSVSTICKGTTVNLSVSNIMITPTVSYTYVWTAIPSTGSGLSGTYAGASLSVTPTAFGTYQYVAHGSEIVNGCNTYDTVVVIVNETPVIDSMRASATNLCVGGSSTIIAYSSAVGRGPQTMPVGYLASAATSASDDEIFNVTINATTLNNTSNCSTVAPGTGSIAALYSNYATGFPTTDLMLGNTFTGSITIGQCLTTAYSTGYSIFMDLNRNGAFDLPAERMFSDVNVASPVTGIVRSFSFAIPNSASLGKTLMRVVAVESTTGASINPTGTYTWGETEDYAVDIIPPVTNSYNFTWTPSLINNDTVTVSPTATTTYTVLAVDNVTGCASATPGTITINVLPVGGTATATPAAICIGYSSVLSVTPSGVGPFITSWKNVATNTVIGTSSSLTVRPTATTTYNVTVTDACSNSVNYNVTVTVNPLPTASIDGVTTVELCEGLTHTMSATTDASTPTFQWFKDNVVIIGATGSTYGATTFGYYTVRVTDTIGCPKTSAAVQVQLRDLPSAFTMNTHAATICEGTSITLTAVSTMPVNGALGVASSTITTNGNPYRAGFAQNVKTQLLYKASELNARGLSAGASISSIAFNITSISGAVSYSNFGISLAQVASVGALTTTFATPTFTSVYSRATYAPIVGLNTHTFSTPYVWNGTSDLIVQVCQTTTGTGTVIVSSNEPGFVATTGLSTSTSTCASTTGGTNASRPLITASAINPLPIVWTPSTGLNTTSGSSVIASPVTTTKYYVSATNAFGCNRTDSATVTVNNCYNYVNLKLYIEGYYVAADSMASALSNSGIANATATQCDTIVVEARNATTGALAVPAVKTILNTNGTATLKFIGLTGDYYLAIKHRNAMETWTANPLPFAWATATDFDFTDDAAKAYGYNQADMGNGNYAFFSGDLNRDGVIEADDYSQMENDILSILFGYYKTDLTGDGSVEAADYGLMENNVLRILFAQTPF